MNLCECGCGHPAPIATSTDQRWGHVKGQPQRFILGHANRRDRPDYIEQDRGYKTPCWIWNRGINAKTGYGQGKSGADAHRNVYEQHRGRIPRGLDLDHLCRVRACVNPDHLEPVTRSENNLRGFSGHHPQTTLRRLTDAQVLAIRETPPGTRGLGKKYGVSRETIRTVRNGTYYQEVTA